SPGTPRESRRRAIRLDKPSMGKMLSTCCGCNPPRKFLLAAPQCIVKGYVARGVLEKDARIRILSCRSIEIDSNGVLHVICLQNAGNVFTISKLTMLYDEHRIAIGLPDVGLASPFSSV
ncbi:hypothetical protein FOZ62_019706, partial [Perkinsus olseni]